ncbi:phosphotransferase system HPr-like phosphotransfer protein [Desulfosalsimonas propionicica]|uniref:Phosphotransferase system HPr-like phosphotransfer protein n=1 Tax=Desulfosalsimonas propionicica TaxID=332175 RepID=A0A7W0HLJ7_9BACT|nr:HPr family phosphocarrier protein [Desulfosalsimonas propionicica]MBA2882409.1 phosphotransferase system HPr-like phosphotransfer protein [Desulfosalsimonas propionicica]
MEIDAANGLCDLSFGERVRFYSHNYMRCLMFIRTCTRPEQSFTKSLYSKLITSSHLLEDFLDFHGAKNNADWYYYREMTAAVRHLSLAGYTQKHVLNRLVFYDIDVKEDFRAYGEIVLSFINGSLSNLAPAILEEASRLGIAEPAEGGYPETNFPGVSSGEMLDYNIYDEDKDQQRNQIVRVANEFLSIADDFDTYEFYEVYDRDGLKALVPEKVNEVEIRRFEMLVHNLQSSFDSYVIQGGFRYGNRGLKQFRSYFSVIFHLLQIMGRLLHFYERHLIEVGYKNIYRVVRRQLCELVDPDRLLDCTINYGLYYVNHYFASGRDEAREILKENVEKGAIQVPIPKDLGFHCRPSLLVAKVVQRYGGQVDLVVDDHRFDASSVLDIQWAGGMIQKEGIKEVSFEGDVRALKDIEVLAGVNYGEDRMGKGIPLPKSLKYLR